MENMERERIITNDSPMHIMVRIPSLFGRSPQDQVVPSVGTTYQRHGSFRIVAASWLMLSSYKRSQRHRQLQTANALRFVISCSLADATQEMERH